MSWVGGSHHIFGVEHLRGELRHGHSTVLLATTGSQRRETRHEKVETRERNYQKMSAWEAQNVDRLATHPC